MKKHNILRKAGAVFLSLALAVGLVPGMEARKVLAAEELSQNSEEAEEGSVSFKELEGAKGASGSEEVREPSTDENGTYQISASGELYWFAGLVNGTIDGVEADPSAMPSW